MQATGSLIYFSKQSKPTPKKKKGGQKSTVLEWIRRGYTFPPEKPAPHNPPRTGSANGGSSSAMGKLERKQRQLITLMAILQRELAVVEAQLGTRRP